MGYVLEKFDLREKPLATKVLLCEGASELGLSSAYLTAIGADESQIAVMCFQGLGKMATKIRAMAKLLGPDKSTLEHIRAVGILADSETDPAGRMDQMIALAQSLAFLHPAADLKASSYHVSKGRVFAIALSPNQSTPGRIEDLIMQEHVNDPLLNCLSGSFGCIHGQTGISVDQKAIVQMLISAKANSSIAGIRKAFELGFFDVMHPAYAGQRNAIDRVLAA